MLYYNRVVFCSTVSVKTRIFSGFAAPYDDIGRKFSISVFWLVKWMVPDITAWLGPLGCSLLSLRACGSCVGNLLFYLEEVKTGFCIGGG